MLRYTDADLRFLAAAVGAGNRDAVEEHLRIWRADPERVEPWLDDDRILRSLMADDRAVVELSPRFLFTVLLRRIRRDLTEIPYTVERIEPDGRLVVFDAGVVHALLGVQEMFEYLVELLVSFERTETVTVRRSHPRHEVRRLNTLSIDDMVELAGLVEPPMRPLIFRRIGDIALFTTGLFPEAIRREPRRPLPSTLGATAPRRWRRLEDYEEEGRRFYRLAADQLSDSHPGLARVLVRLAEEFTIARKPLAVLSERYVSWARPYWAPPYGTTSGEWSAPS
ncbi:MAG: hypothetical protein HY355_00400 [Armatimonadetes bacterium]|nr:hypothetical protein [Armatimonadota bacterium]